MKSNEYINLMSFCRCTATSEFDQETVDYCFGVGSGKNPVGVDSLLGGYYLRWGWSTASPCRAVGKFYTSCWWTGTCSLFVGKCYLGVIPLKVLDSVTSVCTLFLGSIGILGYRGRDGSARSSSRIIKNYFESALCGGLGSPFCPSGETFGFWRLVHV